MDMEDRGVVDLVLDIETFGVTPGVALASVAVVNLWHPEQWRYRTISEPSGRIEWGSLGTFWVKQPPVVQLALSGGLPERTALADIAIWIGQQLGPDYAQPMRLRLWGDEDFDTVLLAEAYRRNGLPVPWDYHAPRSIRTFLEAAGMEAELPFLESETEHVSIDCAQHAARELRLAFSLLSREA